MPKLLECQKHGKTKHVAQATGKGREKTWRCRACRNEQIDRHRKEKRDLLVKMFGGACWGCGYDRYVGALDFHHIDPSTKKFQLALNKMTWAWSRILEEAKKCALVCATCHREIEAGVRILESEPRSGVVAGLLNRALADERVRFESSALRFSRRVA